MASITIDTGTDVIEMDGFPPEEIGDHLTGLRGKLNRLATSLSYKQNALESSAQLPDTCPNPGQIMRSRIPTWRGINETMREIEKVKWLMKYTQAEILYFEALLEEHLEAEREATRQRVEADLVDVETGYLDRDEAWARYG